MIAAPSDDNGVDGRAPTAAGATDGVSYAVLRTPRRRRRFVVPAVAVGLGAVLGGAALAVLQLL